MEKGSTLGWMAGLMKETGRKTTCMVMEFINGATGGSMKESTFKIRKMVTVVTSGLMGEGTKDTGAKANNTEKESIFYQPE